MIAGLSGPVYVERTALYDQKSRKRTKKAIAKALRLQMEGRGMGFVEVLAECPTHLRMTPLEAEAWVRDEMTKHFPLGVLKDEQREPWFKPGRPEFDPDRMLERLEVATEEPVRSCAGFPAHLDPDDVSLKLAGAGGDGAQTAAMLITRAAIREGFDATHIPSYGPESRGGTSYADVHVARGEVIAPASPRPHVLAAFNAPSLAKFGPTVRPGGTVLYDSSVITGAPDLGGGVRVVGVPAARIAQDLGKPLVKNMVALGALQEATGLLSEATLLREIEASLKDKCAMIEVNREAFAWGVKAVRQARAG
jgi:Pyruvate/2-oxoacid:ferredoxin oxidoreductase gamma subunit